MNVVFILKQPYPNGMACSKRVHLYAKGLSEHGNNVSIIIPRATESGKVKNTKTTGFFEGINYQYTSKSTIRPKFFLRRRMSDIFSPLRAAVLVYRLKPDVVFLISPLFYHTLIFKLVCLLRPSEFVKEKNEVPFMHNDTINVFQKLYLRFLNSFFNGVVMITKELDSYYKNHIKSATTTCIIPIIVEFKDNIHEKDSRQRSNKLLYTGALLNRKDGILTILEAFKYVLKKFPVLELYITGDERKSSDYPIVLNKLQELDIKEKVFFTGFLSEQELKDLMEEADILLLAKPLNRQNKYNFPTKVGEYLSSGTPVLISDVGEILNYLKDKQNVFISKPEAIEFSNKIIYIIENYEFATEVAKNGSLLAMKEFDYKACTLRLNDFFEKLKQE